MLELDPATGDVVRTVVANVTCPLQVAVDPLTGDLFTDDACSGAGSDNASLWRIRNPGSATPTFEVYATLPSSANGQIAIAPDGTIYVVTGYYGNPSAAIVRVGGTNTASPPSMTTLSGVTSSYTLAIGETLPSGDAKSLLVDAPNGDLQVVDITTDPPTATVLAHNLPAGVIGPDGCMYATTADTVYKLTDPSGSCGFNPTGSLPTLSLTPAQVSPDPIQGGSQPFTATIHNLDVPAGTPVFVHVTGANQLFQLVRTDASGAASFSYTGVRTGVDEIVATALVGDQSLESNVARVTWDAGKHVSVLSLNPSPRSGSPGAPAHVIASLTDASVDPPAPVAGVEVSFALGAGQCSGVTDASGMASCDLTLPSAAGMLPLGADFAGTDALTGSSDSVGFDVLQASALDAFLTYKVSNARGAPKLVKFGPVTLADAFGSDDYDVLRATQLGAPAGTGGGSISDPDTQLELYAVSTAPHAPKFQALKDVKVTNQCSTLYVKAAQPTTLMVPTAASPSDPVAAPDPATSAVDHFLCYRVQVEKKLADGTKVPGFVKGAQVDVADVTDLQHPRRYDLKRLVSVCNPVQKSGSPVLLAGPAKGTAKPITPADVRNPGVQLACYSATLATRTIEQDGCGPAQPGDKGTPISPKQSPRPSQLGVLVANQFGTGALNSKKPGMLCLPSQVAAP